MRSGSSSPSTASHSRAAHSRRSASAWGVCAAGGGGVLRQGGGLFVGAQPVRRPVPGHRPQPGPQALLRVQLPGVGPQGQEYVGGQLLHVLPGAPPGQHPHHDGAHIGGEAVDGPLQGQAAALPELLCQRDLVQLVPLLSKNRFYQYIRSGGGLVTEQAKKFPEAWPRGRKEAQCRSGRAASRPSTSSWEVWKQVTKRTTVWLPS